MGIEIEKAGAVAVVTIANGKVNPITQAMHLELLAALRDVDADPEIRVGILTGAGERAFSAGDDIKHEDPGSGSAQTDLRNALGSGAADDGHSAPPGYDWADAVMAHSRATPFHGAVRGWCLGRALGYLLALTDIRVCAPDARFGLPEIAYGMGGMGGTFRLNRHLPSVVAHEMALTGEPIDAAEALRVNRVNRVVPAEELLPEAHRIAQRIARHPALAVRVELASLRRAASLAPDDASAYGMALYRAQRLAMGESDVQDTFPYQGR
jgi:enoyl-CoA hydratase/carnithine racemase